MGGINNTLSIAKGAIQTQQYGLNVAGHNISNVNNPNYSRQTLPIESSYPINYGGLIFGTGVTVDDITQVVNKYMENRITDNQSNMSALNETKNYLNVIDSLLNENDESSISSLISGFFDSWQDLSNNPGGAAERIAVYESGVMLSEELKTLNIGLENIQTDLSSEIQAGVSRVNTIVKEIADLNKAILGQESVNQRANDLRDKRTGLIRELGEYLDVKTFEQPSGSTIVTTKSGFTLVYDQDTYGLGIEDGKIMWQGSYGNNKDITDKINTGKIGGWLEMKDATIPRIRGDLESLTREMIWQVNLVHSQGTGASYFDRGLTGEYKTDDSLWLSTLDFGDRIDYSKDFKMWVEDSSQEPSTYKDYEFDMGISTSSVSNFKGTVLGTSGSAPPYEYRFTVVQGGTVDNKESSEDPVIQWEKYSKDGIRLKSGYSTINEGTVTVDSTTNPLSSGISFDIGSGKLVAGNTFSINTNDNAQVDNLDLTVDKNSKLSLQKYKFKVVSAGDTTKGEVSGEVGIDPITIEWTNEKGEAGTFTLTPEDPYYVPLTAEVDGMRLSFNGGTMIKDNIFVVTTDKNGVPSLEDQTDFKWTLKTFANEFNKNVDGVRASVTPENRLSIEPETDGFTISDVDRTGNIHSPDTRISVKNYSALSQLQEDIRITRDSSGEWSLSGISASDYMNASIVPPPLKVNQTAGAANAVNSEYSFSVAQGGEIGTDTVIINWSNSDNGASGTITLTPPLGSPAAPGIDGMDLDFASGGRLYEGDEFTLKTDAAGAATLDQVPHDKGFGIDLTGDNIADIDVNFLIPVQGAGSLEFSITPDEGEYGYAFSDSLSEGPGILAAAGINTFFSGSDIRSMGMNQLLSDVNYIAAGDITVAERPPIGSDNKIELPITISSSNNQIVFTEGDSSVLTATIDSSLTGGLYETEDELDILAADIEKSLEEASYYGIDYDVSYNRDSQTFEIAQKRGVAEKEITFHWNNSSAGESLGFNPDDDVISPPVDVEEGIISKSDNSNAIALLDVQTKDYTMASWTYERGKDPFSEPVTTSIEGFYRGMLGGLGVQAVSVERSLDFSETLGQRLTLDRDAVSGVSLDEEMINLIKFQHAYTVASKLLTVSDEMLQTLVSMR